MSTAACTLAELVQLHADAVAADKACAERTTCANLDAALAAHDLLAATCEVYRQREHPDALEVIAVFGEVYLLEDEGTARRLYTERRKVTASA